MKWTYSITADDYLAGRRLAKRKKRSIRILLRVAIALVVLVGLLQVRDTLRTYHRLPWLYWACLFVVGYVCFLLYVMTPRLIRKAFEQQPHLREPVELELEPGSLSIKSSRRTESFALSEIRGWKLGETVMVVFPPQGDPLTIPLRAFERETDKDRLVKALRNALSAPKDRGRTRA